MVQLTFADLAIQPDVQGPPKLPMPLRLELELSGMIKGEARKVSLDLQLAPGTTAADLAEVVTMRFKLAGFDILAPSADRREKTTRGTLFIQDALQVNLRLMGPVRGTLTTSEGPPQSLRVRVPAAHVKAGKLLLTGTAKHPHQDTLELLDLSVDLKVKDNAAAILERLHEASMELGLLSGRPGGNSWQPVRTTKGGLVTGLTISVIGGGDWRVELELPKTN